MKKAFNFFLVLIFSAYLLEGCEKEPIIEMTQSSYSFSDQGSSQTISFSTNKDWTAYVSGGSWCSISPSSGSSDVKSITVNVTANDTYDDRSATITIKVGELTKAIIVTQPENKAIILTKKSYNVADTTITITVELKSNVSYLVTIPSAAQLWITQAQTKALKTEQLQFNIARNTAFEPRSAEIIIRQSLLTIADTLHINQDVNYDLIALRSLYNSTNGDNWIRKNNWLSNKPLNEWEGVYLDNKGRVYSLDLGDNNLIGRIPPEVSNFKFLSSLKLQNNNISDNLPDEFSRLNKLSYLDLSNNRLTGNLSDSIKAMPNWLKVIFGGISTQQHGFGLSNLYDGITIDGVTWAPVNLGYDLKHKYGLLYQWHRKYGQPYENESPAIIINSDPLDLIEGNKFIYKDNFFTNSLLLDWAMPYTNWDMETLYNPCPLGWRVPKISELENLMKYGSTMFLMSTKYSTPGRYIGPDHSSVGTQSVFFPFGGRLENGQSGLRGEEGYYWAIEGSRSLARAFIIIKFGNITNSYSSKSSGYSIRCVKE